MNAQIQTIKKSININASQEKVWPVLIQDNFNRIWFAAFSEGVIAETNWQIGTKAKFIDNKGDGIVGTVIVNRLYEVLSIEYDGLMIAGTEDYESAEAQAVKGSRETYRLSEKEGATQLTIECDTAEEYFGMMAAAWDNALLKIKELAEANS